MRMDRTRVVGLLAVVAVVAVGAWGLAPRLRAAEEDVLHPHPPIPADAFRISDDCALCHAEGALASAMHDAAGRDVSPFALWQSSMMANAVRDPVWQAAVAVEMAATPSRAGAIEQACMRCHAPMATPGTDIAQILLTGADDLLLAPDDDSPLALDGVSCTVCHRILPERLGKPDSFSGNWRIDPGDRAFGPHEDPFFQPMRMHTGLVATASDHVLDAGLCGTCHTLFTDALSPDGRPTGSRLPEQSPYLEWRNSRYTTETDTPAPEAATCQDCHLPTTDLDGRPIRTRIAHNPRGRDFGRIEARAPFGRHVLVGGNALTPKLLQDPALPTSIEAPAAAFEQTIARVHQQLAAAADLEVVRLEGTQDDLVLDLRVVNRTGHRLPTAHPTRRVWLEVVVEDGGGKRLFASGLTDASGRILGRDGKPLPSEHAGGPVLPHRDRITSGDEVALYEATMVDDEGRPTNLLIRGARFAKDDRLLPAGWRPDGPHPEATLPHGVEGDGDFGAGGDVVHYRIPLPGTPTPGLEIRVRLLHQTVGARWLAEWFAFDLPATRLLKSLLSRTPARPEEIARMKITVTPK